MGMVSCVIGSILEEAWCLLARRAAFRNGGLEWIPSPSDRTQGTVPFMGVLARTNVTATIARF